MRERQAPRGPVRGRAADRGPTRRGSVVVIGAGRHAVGLAIVPQSA